MVIEVHPDDQYGPGAIPAALEAMRTHAHDSFEIIAQACYQAMSIGEVPVTYRYYEGVTQISFQASLRYAIGMQRVLLRYVAARAGRRDPVFRVRRGDG